MELQTKYHGLINVNEKDVLHFEHGIPGFLDEKEFILLQLEKDSPFLIMQSVKTVELGFIVVEPFQFFTDYEFDLSDNDLESLHITSPEEMQIVIILTVKDPFSETTANLKAPIIINHQKKHAKQIILNDGYQTKHKIIQEQIKK